MRFDGGSTDAGALLLVAALAACSTPTPRSPRSTPTPRPSAPDTTMPSPGGLSAAQIDNLSGLGVPVLIPATPGAFDVANVAVERSGPTASYAIDYRRADGVCFEVSGGNDGFGGPEMPLVSTDVRVADLARDGPGVSGRRRARCDERPGVGGWARSSRTLSSWTAPPRCS